MERGQYSRLPGYMARVFEDYRLPVELVLVCSSDTLADRYRKGVSLGPDSFIGLKALGPSDMPSVMIPDNMPTAAAGLVAATLASPPTWPEARSFVGILDHRLGTIEPGRAADYAMYLLSVLPDMPALYLEEIMETKSRPYHSKYSDRLRNEGREKGREEGRIEGALEHSRLILLSLLESSPAGITREQREQIEACVDLERLDAWIKGFAAGKSGSDLLDE